MDLGLAGRLAIVTGASKGIGAACAERLAAEGCDLVLAARSADALAALAASFWERYGVAADVEPMDLADSRSVDALAARWSAADILVNNAGDIPGGTLDEVDEARWRAGWELKVHGYVNMCRRFYAHMQERRRGVIVNVIGAAGESPDSAYIAGSAGNAALMAFTRALGGTSPDHGIRVVGVNPGPIRTDRIEKLLRRRAQDRFGDAERWPDTVADMPFGRLGSTEETAALVAFLASDLSGYTTGTIVTQDGGMSGRRKAF